MPDTLCRRITPEYAVTVPNDVAGAEAVIGMRTDELLALPLARVESVARRHPLEVAVLFRALPYAAMTAAFDRMPIDFRTAIMAWCAAHLDAQDHPDMTFADWMVVLVRRNGIDPARFATMRADDFHAINQQMLAGADLRTAYQRWTGEAPAARLN